MGKIECPRFDGTNLKEWLFKVEEFFGEDSTPEHLKGKMAAIHFDGQASTWTHDLILSGVGLEAWNDWKVYVKLLREQFEDDCDDDQPPNGEFGESIEHRMVKLVPEAQEENPKLENHEGVILEVEGDVEKGQEVQSMEKICSAHKVFVKMPSKEKRMKHLKAWKFKFKPTSKRSKLMDDMFSLVEETALLKKDPKETIWDCVKKEFKETMVAYGKTRVDRFKLVDKKESRPEVMDMNQTFLYHQIGHGVDTLLVLKRVVHDKEMAVVRQRATSLMICDCSNRSSRANRVWKPGGLLCVQDHSGGSILMITQQFHGLQLQRIIYMDMKFQEVLIDDVLSVMVCLRMDETSSDLLLLNGKENEGCLNGSQALVLMKGITESSSRIEELMKEEPDFVKVNEVKMEKQKQRKCSKCWMFKFRKKNVDQWLGFNLISTYLENKKTWTMLRVTKHDNLSWKEDASDGSRSRSSCCIVKLGGAAITSKNVLEKTYDENLEIVDWSKRPGRSEFICEEDDFGDQESSKFRKFVVEFTDLSTVAKTQDLGSVHVPHKDAVLDSKLGCTILSGDVIICPLADHLKPEFVVFLTKEASGKVEQFSGLCKELTDIDVSLASFYVRLRQTSFVVQQVRRNKKIRPSKRWWFKYKYHCYSFCQESFAYQITSFSTNLEVKVSLKGEDLLQIIWAG